MGTVNVIYGALITIIRVHNPRATTHYYYASHQFTDIPCDLSVQVKNDLYGKLESSRTHVTKENIFYFV